MALSAAALEKASAAERSVGWVRLGIIAVNTFVWLALMDRSGHVTWLAYAVLALVWTYGPYTAFARPYERFPVMQTVGFLAVTDGLMIALWVVATGGWESPFYVIWYASILAIAFRYSTFETMATSGLYAASYLVLLGVINELPTTMAELLVRLAYIPIVGWMGALIARETLHQTEAKAEMDKLAEASQRVSGELDLERALERIVQQGMRIVGADRAAVYLLENEGEQLHCAHSTGLSDGYLRAREAVFQDLPGHAVLEGDAIVHVEDAQTDPRLAVLRDAVRREGFRTYTVMPLTSNGRTFGAMTLYRDDVRPFSTKELETAIALSRQATTAIENAQLVTELRRRADELARSNEELERFAYVASHDLKEPLRMVSSYMQLLERRYGEELDEDAHEYIGFARDGAERMDRLITDLLLYSRLDHSEEDVAPTDLGVVVDQVLADLGPAIEEAGATITRDPLPVVPARTLQMAQMLQNLVGNALKFRTQDAPRVHISAGETADGWAVSVADNGPGISPDAHETVFTLFHRQHTHAEAPGSGIGLAVCKKIVEGHGGRIWIEPAGLGPRQRDGDQAGRNRGTTFVFTLPAEPAAQPPPARALLRTTLASSSTVK